MDARPQRLSDGRGDQRKEKRERARQTGLWAAHVPEQYGGAGLSLTEFAHLSEAATAPR